MQYYHYFYIFTQIVADSGFGVCIFLGIRLILENCKWYKGFQRKRTKTYLERKLKGYLADNGAMIPFIRLNPTVKRVVAICKAKCPTLKVNDRHFVDNLFDEIIYNETWGQKKVECLFPVIFTFGTIKQLCIGLVLLCREKLLKSMDG